eukprot:783044-Amorphochlora_amoeboformis.AAC.1
MSGRYVILRDTEFDWVRLSATDFSGLPEANGARKQRIDGSWDAAAKCNFLCPSLSCISSSSYSKILSNDQKNRVGIIPRFFRKPNWVGLQGVPKEDTSEIPRNDISEDASEECLDFRGREEKREAP